jgi:hypothetical protein
MAEKNDHENLKNQQCDDKLKEQERDMNDECDRDMRESGRAQQDKASAATIKMNHSWNIKCKKEKDEVASEEIEKCLAQT